METRWTHDGVVLAVPARDAQVSRHRFAVAGVFTSLLAGGLVLAGLVKPAPAPVCTTAALCETHLPADVNPVPPDLPEYVDDRVSQVIESVRTEDRLPTDIDVVDRVSLGQPGEPEWAFLAAEHREQPIMADVSDDVGVTGRLRRAHERYREDAGEGRVHFQDETRFLAEIQAVRAALDRKAARARLDELAAMDRNVFDVGRASTRELVSAATAVAEAEWRARRQLERIRLDQVTERLVRNHTQAGVSWLFAVACGVAAFLFGLAFTGVLGIRARRAQQPVQVVVGGRGICMDGAWVERERIVWVGLRDRRLRVVTREGEVVSRAVSDDRMLHAALREWRRLQPPVGEPNPVDEARVRRLLR